jgi:diacylglycerol kinase family enzyme
MKAGAVVLLNEAAGSVPASGPSDVAGRVSAVFAHAGVRAEVRIVDGRAIAGEVRAAVARGDGTLSSAAEALVGGRTALGVLPLGTRNHFARDLGLPTDVEEAARVIAAGHARGVDVGEVNGRIFLNNCSLGVYPDLVRDREAQETREERRRWAATLRASWGSLRRFRVRTVTLRTDGRIWRVTTPLVFVGNNRYETRLFALGRRTGLDEGLLWLYVARNTSRLGIVRLGARMLLGRLEQAQDFEALAGRELELRTTRRHLRLAVDGEVVPMVSPLRFQIRPRGLSVFAPPGPA